MPFERPTLADLIARTQADLVSRLELTSAPLRRSVVRVLARVWAGAVHMLHGFLEYLGRQQFPDLSDDAYLVRHASLYGLTKSPATFATGTVQVTCEAEADILSGTILRRSDGAEFEVTEDTNISLTGTVPVTAVLAGDAGNCDSGTVLTFESPIAGVDSETTVTVNGLTGGADTESTEALRTRLLQRLRETPQGGAASDYVTWALSVPGVTRAWVYPTVDGAGTVAVRFVRDNDASLIPSSGEVAEVQAYIDERRPVTAAVTVYAPTAKTWNFTIAVEPDTTAVRDAVEGELQDLFQEEGEPGVTLPLSRVRTAIGSAAGIEDYTLTTPSGDLTHTANELPVLGTVTWA